MANILGRVLIKTKMTYSTPFVTFEELDHPVRALWAKSGELGGHGLLAHMLDVAAVAEVLLEHEPSQTQEWIAGQFELPRPAAKRWLAALVGLHDFGKASPGFQSKWPQGWQADEAAGLDFPSAALERDRHDIASAAVLGAHLQSLGLDTGWIRAVLQAISAHHGFNLDAHTIRNQRPIRESPVWHEARIALFQAYWSTLAPQGLPQIDELKLPAVEWLAGLTSVADWIGSNQEWFVLGERDETLAGHFSKAKELAKKALSDIGWPTFQPLLQDDINTDQAVTRILKRADTVRARPLQTVADSLLASSSGPVLMIVEAPMGEGKTELAFLAHLRLQAANAHRGLYLALPTQATGNAMFDRTLTFLQAFAGGIKLDVQLAHGGAILDERIQQLRNVWGKRGDDIGSSAWFSQRRRGLLSPYGVGTVDQALFATLNVKHHFVRLWGLANRVVVLDEVHAYDTYTHGLIEALLRWLKALHCSVVLMSATLPARKRYALLQSWGASEDVPDTPYPRVLMADAQGIKGRNFPVRSQAPITVTGLDESLETLAATALAKLSHGGCGAIIVNTVDRAQQLYRMLQTQLDDSCHLLLFHARYPADERRQRELDVLQLFGPPDKCQRPERALLIATQVAEQSLDIDFDFLLSDLAPVDLLLQRAGRLHRHPRAKRPVAHGEPTLAIAGLLPDRLPEVKQTAWGRIYGEYLCYVSWAVLRGEPRWCLPEDIDRLVQAVYADEPNLGKLSEDVLQKIEIVAKGEAVAIEQFQSWLAKHAAIDVRDEPHNAYADKPHGSEDGENLGIRNRTRLGDDSISVVPLHQTAQGLWLIQPDGEGLDPQLRPDDAMARQLFARQLKLSRKDIIAVLKEQPVPIAFTEHPLLNNLKPLLFSDGVCTVGKLLVRLDIELGLVYQKVESQTQEGA